MDHLSKIREWHDYYKGRYDKAVSLNLVEGDKHYAAFKEIEYRYVGLAIAVEFLEMLPEYMEKRKAAEATRGFVIMISDTLFLGEIIRNENGKKEYIRQRIKIKKEDTQMRHAFFAAKAAVERFSKMDYACLKQEVLFSEIAENLWYLLQWYLMARETAFPVEKKRRKHEDCA